jgi:hypothetical protein
MVASLRAVPNRPQLIVIKKGGNLLPALKFQPDGIPAGNIGRMYRL